MMRTISVVLFFFSFKMAVCEANWPHWHLAGKEELQGLAEELQQVQDGRMRTYRRDGREKLIKSLNQHHLAFSAEPWHKISLRMALRVLS